MPVSRLGGDMYPGKRYLGRTSGWISGWAGYNPDRTARKSLPSGRTAASSRRRIVIQTYKVFGHPLRISLILYIRLPLSLLSPPSIFYLVFASCSVRLNPVRWRGHRRDRGRIARYAGVPILRKKSQLPLRPKLPIRPNNCVCRQQRGRFSLLI